MKRYRFRLEQVLRVRRLQEDRARAELLAANHHLIEVEAGLRAHLDRYEGLPGPVGALATSSFLTAHGRRQAAAGTVMEFGARRRQATAEVDERRQAWSEAARRVSALERLDRRRRDEHALEALREEEREVDDLVVSRHGRHR